MVDKVSLYPPGKIVHLVKTSENVPSLPHKVMKLISCGMSSVGSEYTSIWASNTQDFNEIVVSPTMGTDHFMDRMCLELETLAATFGTQTGCDIACNYSFAVRLVRHEEACR